jgi:hypothetical protein
MRYLFTLLILVITGMSAHGQSPSDATKLITAADKKLLAECRLLKDRPDLRTPTLRDSISRALQVREHEWIGADDGNETVRDARFKITFTCYNALDPQPTPVTPSTPVKTATAADPGPRPPTMEPSPPRDSPNVEQIEPWPPPRPTDQAEYSIDRTNFKTVGEFEDALMARLNGAGMRHLRFWGAPGGVAVVVPIETIDGRARPVKTNATTGGTRPEQGGPLSALIEGFLQLVSEPIRDSRILLFVLTNDSKAKHPTVPMTKEIGDQWMQNDYMRPEVNRSVELTDQHFVLVAVYEFRKENNENDPALLTEDHKRHSLTEHLAASQLDINGFLK